MEWRGREWRGGEGRGVEGRAGQGRAGQGRVPDCLGGLSRVGISSRSTRPWNGQPPSISTRENPLPLTLNGEELKNVAHFKYLGSVIDNDGTIDRDLDLRVKASWSSWRKLIGVAY